ncbi:uncharacterized protein LY89DRAFT_603653 [Mollisia scopiformis]|uniref:HMG box domain-containing protein n=1 Tax=Mollisia scopiformis TaxID=149040 RepID=A0A132B1H7_MOLSC|nr:uncharacterized protein LY89DRAFT_603653 [Mollisia scopiformis]KUJ06235.1 hypothetical protein LY89DRAFT_603653 [Mollisia scopiformis]
MHISESPLATALLVGDIQRNGVENIPKSATLHRRDPDTPVAPARHFNIVTGRGSVSFNFQPPPIAPAVPPTPANRGNNGRIPRPPNSWILYRSANHAKVKAANPDKSNNEISGIISSMWCDESLNVRQHYAKLAEIAKKNHKVAHPDWNYKPRKTVDIKRRRGIARAVISRPVELFAKTKETLTIIQGSGNQVENSVQSLGGLEASCYQ